MYPIRRASGVWLAAFSALAPEPGAGSGAFQPVAARGIRYHARLARLSSSRAFIPCTGAASTSGGGAQFSLNAVRAQDVAGITQRGRPRHR